MFIGLIFVCNKALTNILFNQHIRIVCKVQSTSRIYCFSKFQVKSVGVKAVNRSVDLSSQLSQPCLSSVFWLSLKSLMLPDTSQFRLIYSEWVLNGTLFHFAESVSSYQFCMSSLSHLSGSHTSTVSFPAPTIVCVGNEETQSPFHSVFACISFLNNIEASFANMLNINFSQNLICDPFRQHHVGQLLQLLPKHRGTYTPLHAHAFKCDDTQQL